MGIFSTECARKKSFSLRSTSDILIFLNEKKHITDKWISI